jgi:heme-degrading monooxygenase HmoA
MFARLTISKIKIERIDEAIKLYEESIVPDAKSQKGFKGLYVLMDRETGNGVSITLWDSEEDTLANEESRYYQEQLVKLMHFMTKPFIREGYEVEVQEKV